MRGYIATEIYTLFFIAAIVAGAINALAGGGGLITFTLLTLVLSPVAADATSAVALVAGYPTAVWHTRGELTDAVGSRWLWLLLIPSVLGGLLGALLLSWSGNRNFVVLVPWLVLGATLLILLRPILVRQSNSDGRQLNFGPGLWSIAVVLTFVVALYGGYFGAGIGILMISNLSFMGLGNARQVVALKNLLTGCLRGVAVAVLIVEGAVNWGYGLPMALGGLVGGYLGGMISKRVHPNVLRIVVICIGFGVAAYYFWRLYGLGDVHVGGE